MHHQEQFRVAAVVALVCACVTLTLGPATAQQPAPPRQVSQQQEQKKPQRPGAQPDRQPQDPGSESIKILTELVQLDVKVIDQAGRPVFDLGKTDFAIYEDKVKQEIESVSREEVPVSMGLAIDTSGSMRAKLRTVSEAALDLIKQMRPNDEIFLAQFKTETELVRGFTSDQRELQSGLGDLYISGGTALLDAIIATADYAQEKGRRRRKAIVVITDGLDQNSSKKEKEVIQVMKEDEVQVYLVGFVEGGRSSWIFGASPARRARDLLMRLAEESGGRAFFPTDVNEMPVIASQIAKELRTQYVISYYPSNEKRDGTFRTVRVEVAPKDKRKLMARTRQGYYAR